VLTTGLEHLRLVRGDPGKSSRSNLWFLICKLLRVVDHMVDISRAK
jgi:hypothetical protein